MSGFLLKLAFRNLWRQRRRTVLTFAALSVGVVMIIFFDSLYEGLDDLGTKNLIELETAHIQIMSEEGFEDDRFLSLDYAFEDGQLYQAVQQLDEVVGITPRLHFSARANTGWEEYGVTGVGVDPALDGTVFPLDNYLTGQWLEPGQSQAVIGERLANLLELERGDYLMILTRAANGAFQALDLEIVGLLNSPHPAVNQLHVYLPLDVARQGLLLGNHVTEYSILLGEQADLALVQERIQREILADYPEINAYTWRQIAADFLVIADSKGVFNVLLMGILVIIAGVGVINTILLGALERTREIGMMKAIGLTEREVTMEFMYEAGIIGFLGSFFGTIAGLIANYFMVNYGLNLEAYMGDIDLGYPIHGTFYGAWNWQLIAIVFLFGILISVVAGLMPAIRTAGKDPIWALRQ